MSGGRRLRVAVNARLLAESRIRGWNRYTIDLLAALARREVDLILLTQEPIAPAHLARLDGGRVEVVASGPMRYARWEQLWIPRVLRAARADVFHTPVNFGLPWSSPCPRVMTLHDAIGRAFHSERMTPAMRFSRAAIVSAWQDWVARTRAHAILTPSEHAKRDLVRHYGIAPQKIVVTPEAADEEFHRQVSEQARASVRSRNGLRARYLFYVGGWEDRKNIPLLVRGLAEAKVADLELVLAGGRDDQRAELQRLAQSLGVADRLRLLGWVEPEELPALYAEALAFVYPSRYEGFGLQLCEAMALAVPTFASRATSLPEVLGDGGATFDPDDPAELAALIARVASEPGFREELIRRARRRSADFSWDRTAELTLRVYRGLTGVT